MAISPTLWLVIIGFVYIAFAHKFYFDDQCKDKISDCANYAKRCKIARYKIKMRYMCPKTCGYCGGPSQLINGACHTSTTVHQLGEKIVRYGKYLECTPTGLQPLPDSPGACQSTRKYVDGYIVIDCKQGKQPVLIGCSPNGNLDTVIKFDKYYKTNSYRFYCKREGNRAIWTVVDCIGFNGKVVKIGTTQVNKDGSKVECVRQKDNAVSRIIYNPVPATRNTKVEGHFVFKTEIIGGVRYRTAIGCAFKGTTDANKYIPFGHTADDDGLRFLCKKTAASVEFNCIGCLDGNVLIKNGQTWQSENATYKCIITDNSCQKKFIQWAITKTIASDRSSGCLLPDGKIIQAGQKADNSDVQFICLFSTTGYRLQPIACILPTGQVLKIGQEVTEANGTIILCEASSGSSSSLPGIITTQTNAPGCVFNDQHFKAKEKFETEAGSIYQCTGGKIVKIGCVVGNQHKLPISATTSQIYFVNGVPYFCPPNYDGVLRFPETACSFEGQPVRVGQTATINNVVVECQWMRVSGSSTVWLRSVILGCLRDGKFFPLNKLLATANGMLEMCTYCVDSYAVCPVGEGTTTPLQPGLGPQGPGINPQSGHDTFGPGSKTPLEPGPEIPPGRDTHGSGSAIPLEPRPEIPPGRDTHGSGSSIPLEPRPEVSPGHDTHGSGSKKPLKQPKIPHHTHGSGSKTPLEPRPEIPPGHDTHGLGSKTPLEPRPEIPPGHDTHGSGSAIPLEPRPEIPPGHDTHGSGSAIPLEPRPEIPPGHDTHGSGSNKPLKQPKIPHHTHGSGSKTPLEPRPEIPPGHDTHGSGSKTPLEPRPEIPPGRDTHGSGSAIPLEPRPEIPPGHDTHGSGSKTPLEPRPEIPPGRDTHGSGSAIPLEPRPEIPPGHDTHGSGSKTPLEPRLEIPPGHDTHGLGSKTPLEPRPEIPPGHDTHGSESKKPLKQPKIPHHTHGSGSKTPLEPRPEIPPGHDTHGLGSKTPLEPRPEIPPGHDTHGSGSKKPLKQPKIPHHTHGSGSKTPLEPRPEIPPGHDTHGLGSKTPLEPRPEIPPGHDTHGSGSEKPLKQPKIPHHTHGSGSRTPLEPRPEIPPGHDTHGLGSKTPLEPRPEIPPGRDTHGSGSAIPLEPRPEIPPGHDTHGSGSKTPLEPRPEIPPGRDTHGSGSAIPLEPRPEIPPGHDTHGSGSKTPLEPRLEIPPGHDTHGLGSKTPLEPRPEIPPGHDTHGSESKKPLKQPKIPHHTHGSGSKTPLEPRPEIPPGRDTHGSGSAIPLEPRPEIPPGHDTHGSGSKTPLEPRPEIPPGHDTHGSGSKKPLKQPKIPHHTHGSGSKTPLEPPPEIPPGHDTHGLGSKTPFGPGPELPSKPAQSGCKDLIPTVVCKALSPICLNEMVQGAISCFGCPKPAQARNFAEELMKVKKFTSAQEFINWHAEAMKIWKYATNPKVGQLLWEIKTITSANTSALCSKYQQKCVHGAGCEEFLQNCAVCPNEPNHSASCSQCLQRTHNPLRHLVWHLCPQTCGGICACTQPSIHGAIPYAEQLANIYLCNQ